MLDSIVRAAGRRFGNDPAVVSPVGWPLTYAELDRASDEVAHGLAEMGIGPGDVLGLLLPSSPDYVVAYAAAAKLGALTAGINPRLTPLERTACVRVIGPDLVVGTGELLERTEVTSPVVPVEVGEDPVGVLGGLRRSAGDPSPPPEDPSRPVALVLTSGTTGTPRAAVFTGRQLGAIGRLDAGEDWGGGGPMLASTELVHVGFMTKLPWYLRRGMTIHVLRRWRVPDALRVISEHRISTVGAIGAQVALMLREPDFDRYDLSAVETLVVGGGPSPPALIQQASDRFGAGYSVRYSSTESGGVGTMTLPDVIEDAVAGTVGRPRAGVEMAVRGEEGTDLAPDEIGEVWIRSPAVMSGYWRDPDATARTLVDGWLRTDDLGSVDRAGRLRLAGRRSEMFIRGGYNVYPLEVEAVLASHPKVEHVAVVPRPDPVMGEVGVAVVVPSDRQTLPSLDELREFAGDRLAHHKLPEELRLIDVMPLNASHKIDRRVLVDQLGSPAGRAV
jgi:acyl-CoA synthetase (AMP-forming)/AMP-acid ligase II